MLRSGVTRDSLTFEEIEGVYKGNILTKETPNRFYKFLNNFTIIIKPSKTTISFYSSKELVGNDYIPTHINDLNHDLDTRPLINKYVNRIRKWLKLYNK